MKKLFLIATILCVSVSCYSQKVEGTFSIPDSEKFIAVDWDWSQTVIDKKFSEKEWAAVNGDSYWEKAKLENLVMITRVMNEPLEKARVSVVSPESSMKTAYTLYICPISYNKKGDNYSDYVLKENSTGLVIGRCQLKGAGGRIGTVSNLLGDGYEEAALKMGKILMKYNKIRKKSGPAYMKNYDN